MLTQQPAPNAPWSAAPSFPWTEPPTVVASSDERWSVSFEVKPNALILAVETGKLLDLDNKQYKLYPGDGLREVAGQYNPTFEIHGSDEVAGEVCSEIGEEKRKLEVKRNGELDAVKHSSQRTLFQMVGFIQLFILFKLIDIFQKDL